MKLAERHGTVLTGRQFAASLVEEIAAETSSGTPVIVDFKGVETVSPSFADELFGKLVARVEPDQVRFENLSGHLETVARLARLGRPGTS